MTHAWREPIDLTHLPTGMSLSALARMAHRVHGRLRCRGWLLFLEF
ncbi:MAG: hypothetical protein U1F68_14840 [Gammaproteobacteria bacterium]